MDALKELQSWFLTQCDDDWEHRNGVEIKTLDNPGWAVSIDLDGTEAETRSFELVEDSNVDEIDWLTYWREGSTFQGRCGPSRLGDVLRIFLKWAARSNPPVSSDPAPPRR